MKSKCKRYFDTQLHQMNFNEINVIFIDQINKIPSKLQMGLDCIVWIRFDDDTRNTIDTAVHFLDNLNYTDFRYTLQ